MPDAAAAAAAAAVLALLKNAVVGAMIIERTLEGSDCTMCQCECDLFFRVESHYKKNAVRCDHEDMESTGMIEMMTKAEHALLAFRRNDVTRPRHPPAPPPLSAPRCPGTLPSRHPPEGYNVCVVVACILNVQERHIIPFL